MTLTVPTTDLATLTWVHADGHRVIDWDAGCLNRSRMKWHVEYFVDIVAQCVKSPKDKVIITMNYGGFDPMRFINHEELREALDGIVYKIVLHGRYTPPTRHRKATTEGMTLICDDDGPEIHVLTPSYFDQKLFGYNPTPFDMAHNAAAKMIGGFTADIRFPLMWNKFERGISCHCDQVVWATCLAGFSSRCYPHLNRRVFPTINTTGNTTREG